VLLFNFDYVLLFIYLITIIFLHLIFLKRMSKRILIEIKFELLLLVCDFSGYEEMKKYVSSENCSEASEIKYQ
jgi:hypothetical protein